MVYEFESFRLDTDRRLLLRAASGEPIHVSPKVIETLLYLVEHCGELVEKNALIQAIWPRVVVEENSLDKNISTLRRVLGERAGENRFIATVPGRGYRFVAPVVKVTGTPNAASDRTAPDAPSLEETETRIEVPTPARSLRMVPMLVLALATVIATWLGISPEEPVPGETRAADGGESATVPRVSVAVLPFANRTGDPALEYVGDGIADELIYSLSRVRGLKVPARTSSFVYKTRAVDIREIGRDLGVATVLEGSVVIDGTKVHVTAQLVDADTGFHVWSQAYERASADVLRLQTELAGTIARALTPSLQVGTTDPGSTPATASDDAYRLFLEANELVGASASNLQRALALYDRAIALDPGFARALAARARTRLTLLARRSLPPRVADDAEHDARLAIALDPNVASAHAALGTVLSMRGQWLEAERAYQAAFAIAPNDPLILGHHTAMVAATGRFQQALEESEAAYDLAPLALPAIMHRAMVNAILERDEAALRDANLGVSLGAPRDFGGMPFILAGAAQRAGRYGEAADHMLALMPVELRAAGTGRIFRLVYEASANAALRPAAAAELRGLASRVDMVDVGIWPVALHTMAGDIDAAYGAANRLIDELAESGLVGTNWFVIWTSSMLLFRQDPRFQAFVQRLNLMDYWAAHGPPDGCTLENGMVLCH